LTRELVQDGLTDLGRTGDGTKMSYLTLSLPVGGGFISSPLAVGAK
jgi:hypothetical protein